jgi:hypothetical protein
LHAHKLGGALVWNGINQLLRDRRPASIVRLQHETWGRSDALLAATGSVPETLMAQGLPLEAFSAQSQFSRAVFETDADVIALSIQPDVFSRLARHRGEGFLFYPHRMGAWSSEQRAWLRDECTVEDFLDVDASKPKNPRLIARIRERSQAAILIYNLSSVVPGERIHSHWGLDELFSTRIRRFNLGLIGLSQKTGISIIDVDSLLARAGTEQLKIDAIHLKGEGSRLVAEEVVRVLDDLGCLPPSETGA